MTIDVGSSSIFDYWNALSNIVGLLASVALVCLLLYAITRFDEWHDRRKQREHRRHRTVRITQARGRGERW